MDNPEESPVAMFQRTLHMEQRVANAFVAGGVEILEELAYVPLDELFAIDGLTESEVQHFRQRYRARLLFGSSRGCMTRRLWERGRDIDLPVWAINGGLFTEL